MAKKEGQKQLAEFLQTHDPGKLTAVEAHHSGSPRLDKIPPFSSSAYDRKLYYESQLIFDRTSEYNPDLTPWQHPLLLYNSDTTVTRPTIREELYEYSEYLQTQSKDRIWQIMVDGWEYEPGGPPPDFVWPDNFKMAFIEAFSKAMVIDSTILTKFEGEMNHEYRIFTRNDVRYIFGNDIRQPTEVYINYLADRDLKFAAEDGSFASYPSSLLGFLLQYSDDKERPRRIFGDARLTYKDDPETFIYRDALMITPDPHWASVYGHPMLKRQLHAALGKIYLPFYAMLVLHKGGSNRWAVIPDSTPDDYKRVVAREVTRGMLSRGMIIGYKGQKLQDEFLINEFEIPGLNFEATNTFLSEDARTSRQDVEGAAETGALGGSAPEVNERNDLRMRDELLMAIEKAIREANDVFFGFPAYMLKNGNIQPTYEIIFPQPEIYEEGEEGGDINPGEVKDKAKEKKKMPEAEAHTVIRGWELNAHAHHSTTVNETRYVTYRGNLFAPGTYPYEDKGYEVTYTPEDIRDLTTNPVNVKDLELQHSYDFVKAGFKESKNLGFLKVIGFDSEKGQDITEFNIEEHTNQELIRDGIVETDDEGRPLIKVSPYFVRKPVGGKMKLFLLNAAVTDARKYPPKAEEIGLTTSARLVKEG